MRAAPLDVGGNVSAKAWRLIAPYDRRHQRALDNLAIAFPEKTPKEREAIALGMWENLGRVMAETMQIDRIIADPDRIEIVTAASTSATATSSAPPSACPCTWATGSSPSGPSRSPATILRPSIAPSKTPTSTPTCATCAATSIPAACSARVRIDGSIEEGQKTARLIMDFVRQGGRLGLVCDLHDRTGLPVPFFGRPAKSVTIPAIIARRVGARIWMSRCLRVGNQSRFQIELKELKVPRTANAADDVKWITAAMQKQFEAWIREAPEQWSWNNRRWG